MAVINASEGGGGGERRAAGAKNTPPNLTSQISNPGDDNTLLLLFSFRHSSSMGVALLFFLQPDANKTSIWWFKEKTLFSFRSSKFSSISGWSTKSICWTFTGKLTRAFKCISQSSSVVTWAKPHSQVKWLQRIRLHLWSSMKYLDLLRTQLPLWPHTIVGSLWPPSFCMQLQVNC